MAKKHRDAKRLIIAMDRAGVPIEKLARDAMKELGVRARFVYRVLGYEHRYNWKTRSMEWVKPIAGVG